MTKAVSAAPPTTATSLSRQEYSRIRAALQFEPRPGAALLTVLVHAAGLACGLWLLSVKTWPAFAASQLLLAIVFFQGFAILHECGHGSFSRSSLINTLVGHYASLLCFMPYYPWKYQHAQHHAWSGHLEKDPGLNLLRKWHATGKMPWLLRLSWRSWIPLGAAVQHVVFWSYPLHVMRDGTRSQFRRCVVSVIWMLAAYAALGVLLPATFNLGNFGIAIVVYLVVVELVNLPHHVDRPYAERKLALWEQATATRSCYYPRFVSEFLVLNFNFHIEHHLFPSLPWYRLRRARDIVKTALGAAYEEERGIAWNLRRRSEDLRDVLNIT